MMILRELLCNLVNSGEDKMIFIGGQTAYFFVAKASWILANEDALRKQVRVEADKEYDLSAKALKKALYKPIRDGTKPDDVWYIAEDFMKELGQAVARYRLARTSKMYSRKMKVCFLTELEVDHYYDRMEITDPPGISVIVKDAPYRGRYWDYESWQHDHGDEPDPKIVLEQFCSSKRDDKRLYERRRRNLGKRDKSNDID